MKVILGNVKVGERYAILDGNVIPVDATNIEFDGWYAHHELDSLPQIGAMADRSLLDKSVASRDYWTFRALPNRD